MEAPTECSQPSTKAETHPQRKKRKGNAHLKKESTKNQNFGLDIFYRTISCHEIQFENVLVCRAGETTEWQSRRLSQIINT